jgi:YesN/AraC family two-component response regulator
MVNFFDRDIQELDDRDELAFIQRSVSELLDSQQTASRLNFIKRLIAGRLSGTLAIKEGCDQYGLDFDNKFFQVMLVYIEELEEEGGQAFSRELLYQLIEQHYENYDVHTLEIEGVPLCLFVYDQPEVRSAIEKTSRELIDTFLSKYKVGMALAFSGVKDDVNLINIAHEESQEALEYELFRGSRTISFYDDLSGEVRQGAFSSYLELETRFFNAIRANQFEAARNILLAEIDRIVTGNTSFLMMKTRIAGIINLIIDAVSELRGVISNDYSSQIQRLLDSDSAESVRTLLSSLLSDMEREVMENQDRDTGPLYQQVDDFLEENYADINLTVGVVADYLSLSDSYLSTMYKKQTGSGLLQSIHKIRIRKARKLLRTCNDNLNVIAQKVGYVNDIALIRSFKRFEGISPGKYRDSLKNQQSRKNRQSEK